MSVIAFDTLDFSRTLKQAGLNEKIADAHADATAKILNDLTVNHLATKEDLKNMEVRMCIAFFKMISIAVGILGGLQTLFHFIK